jgi:cytochrome c1
MSRETLKDRNYRIIGYIETDSQGKQKILDPQYRPRGTFDPKTNKTTDASYRVVGSGNLLTTLLR